MIRYVNIKREEISTNFLDLVGVDHATGEGLFNTLYLSLEDFGLKFENCLGLGTDGASVMVGVNNSVFSRVKENSPDCIFHSASVIVWHWQSRMPLNVSPRLLGSCSQRYHSFSKTHLRCEKHLKSSLHLLPLRKWSQSMFLSRSSLQLDGSPVVRFCTT